MPIYRYKCENCGKVEEKFLDISARKDKIRCECGCMANRIWEFGTFYLKTNFVGDIWDRAGVDPEKNQSPEGRKANLERLKKMRKENEPRVAKARELRKKKGLGPNESLRDIN